MPAGWPGGWTQAIRGSSAFLCPCNVCSVHCSCSWSHFQGHRESMCCWDHLDWIWDCDWTWLRCVYKQDSGRQVQRFTCLSFAQDKPHMSVPLHIETTTHLSIWRGLPLSLKSRCPPCMGASLWINFRSYHEWKSKNWNHKLTVFSAKGWFFPLIWNMLIRVFHWCLQFHNSSKSLDFIFNPFPTLKWLFVSVSMNGYAM